MTQADSVHSTPPINTSADTPLGPPRSLRMRSICRPTFPPRKCSRRSGDSARRPGRDRPAYPVPRQDRRLRGAGNWRIRGTGLTTSPQLSSKIRGPSEAWTRGRENERGPEKKATTAEPSPWQPRRAGQIQTVSRAVGSREQSVRVRLRGVARLAPIVRGGC